MSSHRRPKKPATGTASCATTGYSPQGWPPTASLSVPTALPAETSHLVIGASTRRFVLKGPAPHGDAPAQHVIAQAEVDEVLSQLPPARRAALLSDESALGALTRDLAEAGSEHLYALMKGASE